MHGIKTKYEDAIKAVESARSGMDNRFKNKMIKIKSNLSRFFADMEIRINS